MKAILQNSEEQESPPPEVEELPVREPDEFQDVPVPRKVTRETEAEQEGLIQEEDLHQGDEGVDDPRPEAGG